MRNHWLIRANTVHDRIQGGILIQFVRRLDRSVPDEGRWRARVWPVPILVKCCRAFLPVGRFRLVHHAFHALSHLTESQWLLLFVLDTLIFVPLILLSLTLHQSIHFLLQLMQSLLLFRSLIVPPVEQGLLVLDYLLLLHH